MLFLSQVWKIGRMTSPCLDGGEWAWALHPAVFQAQYMNILEFRFNKLDRFVAKSRNPQTFSVNVLVTLWDHFYLTYAFPPLQLIPCLLHRLEIDGVPGILISLNRTRWT